MSLRHLRICLIKIDDVKLSNPNRQKGAKGYGLKAGETGEFEEEDDG